MSNQRIDAVLSPGSYPVGIINQTGLRVVATATAASTAEAALPVDSVFIELRATAAIWIRFGDTGMGAAAANDVNSILFPPGEKAMPVPLNPTTRVPYTYFRCIRDGAADVPVQIERLVNINQ